MSYVYNPISAFDSRLSSTGTLSKTLEVVGDNIIWGVGSIPIKGELIGDNVYVVLLHAGGMVALLIYFGIYCKWIYKCISVKKYELVLVVILYLLSGFSLPIGWNYKVCMLPCILYFMLESETNYEESNYDSKTFGCRWS